jgi:hypothetical protein
MAQKALKNEPQQLFKSSADVHLKTGEVERFRFVVGLKFENNFVNIGDMRADGSTETTCIPVEQIERIKIIDLPVSPEMLTSKQTKGGK